MDNHDMHDDSIQSGEQPTGNSPASHEDSPSSHGMLLFGEKVAYLSHLPMFMSPHNYQGIFEVMLTNAESDPLALYINDRKTTGTRMYSFVPEENFVLTDLVSPDPEHPLLSSFKGTIWRGHFEDGHFEKQGSEIIKNVVAQVTNVVHFRKFGPDAKELPQLEYFIFGKGQELFLAHVITKAPDFDQVLGARVDGHQFTDEELRHGVQVTFPSRRNTIGEQIKEQEQISGRVEVAGKGGPLAEVAVQAGTEFYFEINDLAVSM